MKATELIDQVKTKTGAHSYYELSQLIDITEQKISKVRKGKASFDAYECTRIAMELGLDPLDVIAQIEAEAARTEKKREFWKSFRSSGSRVILGLLLCGMLAFSALGPLAGGVGNGLFLNRRRFA